MGGACSTHGSRAKNTFVRKLKRKSQLKRANFESPVLRTFFIVSC